MGQISTGNGYVPYCHLLTVRACRDYRVVVTGQHHVRACNGTVAGQICHLPAVRRGCDLHIRICSRGYCQFVVRFREHVLAHIQFHVLVNGHVGLPEEFP
ncbi:hypothetical protein SDC9_153994 [bioreactor metagenome]|uniref:Uncharacterized protein n=1 Tax=bioreactor metagenome TaxID=1076179 RepID=A0A645EXG4_9ZZZZ